jgi:hypothetical protein
MAFDETIRLIVDMGYSAKNVDDVSRSLTVLDKKVDEVAVSTEKMTKGLAGGGQSLLQTGRVVQDFAQGGLGGILNNIEGLAQALGGGPGLAGVMTVLGVTALVAGPAVKKFFDGIIDGWNEVPKAADAVTRMNDALHKNTERLDELRKSQTLTNTELKEFNQLTEDNIELEKKLAEEKKKAEQAKKLDALRPQGAAEAEKERAEELQAQFGGRDLTKMAADIDKDLELQMGRAMEELRNLPPPDPMNKVSQGLRRALDNKIRYYLKQQIRGGKDIVGGAIIGGKAEDIEVATEFMRGADRDMMRAVLPGEVAARDAADEAIEEGNQRAHDARMKREAKAKLEREVKQAEEDAAEGAAEIEDAQRKEDNAARRKSIDQARKAAEAVGKAKPRGDIDLKGLDLGHLPMVQEGMSLEQAANVMEQGRQKAAMSEAGLMQRLIDNQGKLTGQQSNVLQRLRQQADRIAQELTEVGRSGGSNGFP